MLRLTGSGANSVAEDFIFARARRFGFCAMLLMPSPAFAETVLADDLFSGDAAYSEFEPASLTIPPARSPATEAAEIVLVPQTAEPLNPCGQTGVLCGASASSAWRLEDLDANAQDEQAIGLASDQASIAPLADDFSQTSYRITAGGEWLPRPWTDHASPDQSKYRGFFKQSGKITTELLITTAYFSVQSGKKLFKPTGSFSFDSEGWFGKNTGNVGMDKLAHAFNTYMLADVLHMRLHEKTHASAGDAWTAAGWAWTFMALNEISDGIEPDHGYSLEDIAMNTMGAAFSVIRNTVPGVKEKLSFKIEIVPRGGLYHAQGKDHWEQMRFMFSLKGSGFKELKKTPLRFVDLQVGYYATDFSLEDRAQGIVPERHLFVGLGLNVGELLFGRSRSWLGKAGYDVLDYFQIPYTSVRTDTGLM